jgi:tripartite-type tricarboxylate transporter receptor subunit TctC
MKRIVIGLFASALALAPSWAAAQNYPAKVVKLVVPFTAGSSADNIARLMTDKLAAHLKQPFIVDNRAGAGGAIGVQAVVTAPPDGYTLLFTTSSPLVILPSLDKTTPYNVGKDLTPVALVSYNALLLVARPDFPAKNLQELIDVVKKAPGKYSYASNGNGSYSHMSMERFKLATGLDIVHVPYKGPETDLMGGQVALMFDSVTTGLQLVKGDVSSLTASVRVCRIRSPPGRFPSRRNRSRC